MQCKAKFLRVPLASDLIRKKTGVMVRGNASQMVGMVVTIRLDPFLVAKGFVKPFKDPIIPFVVVRPCERLSHIPLV